MFFAVSIWAFGSALAVTSFNTSWIYFWEQFKYIGILIIPPSWALLAIKWTGRGTLFSPTKLLSLYVFSLLFIILIFTDGYHHLIWKRIEFISYGSFTNMVTVHGTGWWFMWTYSYIMILIGMIYFINGLLNTRYIYQKQALILLIGSFFPWIANAIYSFNLGAASVFDFTPAAFIITGVIFAWSFSHLKLIDIPSFAKHAVFEHLDDPVFVFDKNYRLLEINPCAEQLFHLNGKNIIGHDALNIFENQPKLIELLQSSTTDPMEFSHAYNDKQLTFDVHVTCLTDKKQQCKGYLLALRDITERKRGQYALQESEKKFRTYTESASVAIMIYQHDKWIYANPAAVKITGYSIDELRSMYYWDFVHPDYANLAIQRGRKRQQGSTPIDHYELKIISKDGREKWIDLKATQIKYDEKIAVLITANDISDRKEAEEIIGKQLAAITASIDGIAILNANYEYTYLNRAFAEIYGYDHQENLLGTRWETIFSEAELERFQQTIFPQLEKEGRWRGETVGKKKNGMEFNQEVTLTSVPDGGLICVVRDITKQKMVMNELHDAHELLYTVNKNLEKKVKERTAQIENLIKQKDDFINQLGHDLKTPLTPMMVLLPLLKEKTTNEKDLEIFDVVIRNVFFMKDLVNKTIDLAKLNSDKIAFSMESINLNELTAMLVENNQVLLENNRINLTNNISKPLFVQADKLRLNEVFNNLISNAIKYTPKEKGGAIVIDADENETMVTISVKDTGIGMTQEELTQVFNEFYKADESRHDLDSSGLGLTITKKIIEKHGGTIWAESQGKGKGTTFFFTLQKPEILEKKPCSPIPME